MSDSARYAAGRRWRRARRHRSILGHAVLAIAAVIALAPIAWGILTSFKTQANVSRFPPQWLPDPPTLEHYIAVLDAMAIYTFNTLGVAAATIAVTLVVAVHGGYAAARRAFPGRSTLLFLILATMMIPGIAVLIPLYMVAAALGLFNTHAALVIVYAAWQIPMALWLLRGFFETVPREVEEAAAMDGCSRLGVLYRVALPLVTPGLAAVAIVVFIYVWNEFIIALSLITAARLRLVTVGVYGYITAYGIEWGKLMAAVSFGMVPVIVAFLALQKGFIRGLTGGGAKG